MANVALGPVALSRTMPRPPDDADAGLSAAQAAQRLAAEGPNTLPGGQRRTLWAIAAETVREPMLLLLSAGALCLAFGDLQEGLTLIVFVLLTLGLTLYQECKTERAVEALRDLTSPRARVIRDGQPLRVAGRDMVRGDIGRIGSALGGARPGRSPLKRRCPSPSTRWWSPPSWPAWSTRSTRWRRRSTNWAAAAWPASSTCTTTGACCRALR